MTALKTPKYEIINNDLVRVDFTKEELKVFRTFVTTLEFDNQKFILANEKIKLLEAKNISISAEKINYRDQVELTQSILTKNINIQKLKEEEYKKIIKDSKSLGRKEGVVVGVAVTLLACLLIK